MVRNVKEFNTAVAIAKPGDFIVFKIPLPI